MSLRQKLLLLFSLTVAAAVAAVAWTVLVRIRQVFEQRDEEETALIVSQFQREFQQRSTQVSQAVEHLAQGEQAREMTAQITQSGDTSAFVNEAHAMAQSAQLDFLEIVGANGNIISSSQWPARFGYAESAAALAGRPSFLKREDLPDGTAALGLFAVRAVGPASPGVTLVGGERLDENFLRELPVAPGVQIGLYTEASAPDAQTDGAATATDADASYDASRLIGPSGAVPGAAAYKSLILAARATGRQASAIVHLSSRREDSLNATAIPLTNESGRVLAVLTVGLSRYGMVQAQQHIRAIAYGVASAGILLAIAFSLWIAARVSRPIEQLARAAEEVAGGNLDTHVPVRGHDEVSVLAESFNHMTAELASQRERLVQSERVAAWRELARRLSHELKNPLFPLQLTVENMVRARELAPEQFDEVFRESAATLTAEIANLKTIIGRFSDFSKMPKPEIQRTDAREVVERVRSLYATTAALREAKIEFELEVSPEPMPLDADPELLHRALSNLVLNAMDAMPDGGVLRLCARPLDDKVEVRVSDTGAGLTPEECERLFTPYYTTKQHGTGLGLAIVQSVVADHAGTIAVESRTGSGTTFIITLPKAGA
ncbi:MAG TPA: ATP-binding protein [Terracidiphilus sp.]|nr:ATP-binding protein [Terracidiphilus sp.]